MMKSNYRRRVAVAESRVPAPVLVVPRSCYRAVAAAAEAMGVRVRIVIRLCCLV